MGSQALEFTADSGQLASFTSRYILDAKMPAAGKFCALLEISSVRHKVVVLRRFDSFNQKSFVFESCRRCLDPLHFSLLR